MNVKTLFFNRNLAKDVYMTHLDGFVPKDHVSKVRKLQRPFIEQIKLLKFKIFVLMR
jgi:hypothetical protein